MVININETPLYNHIYENSDIIPVRICSIKTISDDVINKLVEKYNKAGFVIFELLDDPANQSTMLKISEKLKLGKPYVPNIYSTNKTIYENTGLNIIKVNNGEHRAFQTNNEQKIHSDGTVEEIGAIKTSMLLCSNPATRGGETVIFNSVAAFHNLIKNNVENQSTLLSLCDLKALRRVAINGNLEEYTGPAFKILNGEIISRFSLDNTCDWEYGFRRVKNLKEAYLSFVKMITPQSPFYIEIKLDKNQGIIMANNKISHGRQKYINDSSAREMIRGLFEKNLAAK